MQYTISSISAIGCLNLVPPEDTWLSRKDREAIVGCYSSRQTWTLRCIESKWIGVIGNCTRGREGLQCVHCL